jgi:hypothetical protein
VLGGHDRSELVAALLWEDDTEEAWREAREGVAAETCLLALARRCEGDHPADALEVYRDQIEPAIRHGDNHTYAGTIDWLEKGQAMLVRLKQEDTFEEARPRDPRAAPGEAQPAQATRRAEAGPNSLRSEPYTRSRRAGDAVLDALAWGRSL